MRRLVLVAGVLLIAGCAHTVEAGPQPDGDHVAVYGHLYEIADGHRPGCFLIHDQLTFIPDLASYTGNGVEEPC